MPCRLLFLGPEPPRVNSALWLPMVTLTPVPEALGKILRELPDSDALVLTSPRALRILKAVAESAGRLHELVEAVRGVTVVAVGPSTAGEARRILGVDPVTPPPPYRVADIAAILQRVRARRVTALRSSEASTRLAVNGVEVREITLYRVEVNWGLAPTLELLADTVNAVAATSPTIARILCRLRVRTLIVSFQGPTMRVLEGCGMKPVPAAVNTYQGVLDTCTTYTRKYSTERTNTEFRRGFEAGSGGAYR